MPRAERELRIARPAEWAGLLIICTLLVVSWMMWKIVRERENARVFDQLSQQGENLQTALRTRLDNIDEPLFWNVRYLEASAAIDRAHFESFNQQILKRSPSILMLEWSPRVWAPDREKFVLGARKEHTPGFEILSPDVSGRLARAPNAPNYYLPILYSVARDGVDSAVGLDVSFTSERQAWYEKSARQSTPVNTGTIAIYVSPKEPSRAGFVHSWPVYERKNLETPQARWDHIRGWIAVVVTLEELFEESLDRYLSADFDIFIYEYSSYGKLLIGKRSIASGKYSGVPGQVFQSENIDVIRSVNLGDRSWGIVLRPTAAWFSKVSHSDSTNTLLLSLAFTFLVGFSLYKQSANRRRAQLLQDNIVARETLLHDVTNCAPVVVYQSRSIADSESRVSFVSSHVKQVLGVTAEEVMKDSSLFYRYVKTSVTPIHTKAPPNRGEAVTEQSDVYCLEMLGQERWVEHRAHLQLSVGPGANITTGYWADITDLKQREQQLALAKHSAEESERALKETVGILEKTRGDLLQSEKLAALGSMVAGVSHELNTPLGNALLGSTALSQQLQDTYARYKSGDLKRKHFDNFFLEALPAAAIVTRSVERAADLISNFKQMAIDQAGQQRSVFNLSELLHGALHAWRTRYLQAPWAFSLSVDSEVAMDSFPLPLEQILNNLILNSIEHGFAGRDHGNIALTVSQEAGIGAATHYVVIVVEDDGVGIPAEVVGRIFDPFFTTRMGRNVGIGLNLAYRMVTCILGGRIVVEPAGRPGARIVLRVPTTAPQIL